MSKSIVTYNFNESRTPSASGAVVVLSSSETKSHSNFAVTSLAVALSLSLIVAQVKYINSNALAVSPISSPITSPESSANPSAQPSSAPITSPEVTPTPANNGGNGSSGGSSGGSSSGGNSGPANCDNQKPSTAPVLMSAVSSGQNSVLLNWSRATNPVTHYSISYGLKSKTPLYGNPNVGNGTSYEVKGLSGSQKYFFTVRGVNGCTAGVASNELSTKVSGNKITYPAQGFKPGILGQATSKFAPKTQFVKTQSGPKLSENIKQIDVLHALVNTFFSFFKRP